VSAVRLIVPLTEPRKTELITEATHNGTSHKERYENYILKADIVFNIVMD
jgi:hypothetical protein